MHGDDDRLNPRMSGGGPKVTRYILKLCVEKLPRIHNDPLNGRKVIWQEGKCDIGSTRSILTKDITLPAVLPLLSSIAERQFPVKDGSYEALRFQPGRAISRRVRETLRTTFTK
jgi:hypothetical protein